MINNDPDVKPKVYCKLCELRQPVLVAFAARRGNQSHPVCRGRRDPGDTQPSIRDSQVALRIVRSLQQHDGACGHSGQKQQLELPADAALLAVCGGWEPVLSPLAMTST